VSLPQRSPAPLLARQAAPGQRVSRPAGPLPAGARPQPGVGPLGQRPAGMRPMAHPGMRPMADRPAPRPTVAFLTVAEVAAIMRVSKMTVYRLVHGGEMAAVRVGRSFRVPEPAVREYLADARTDVA
jgi:excisionase family DNA binding protein